MTERLRCIGAILAAVAVSLALAGTGAFGASVSDRGMSADAVNDDRALVGYDSPDEIAIEYATNETDTTDDNGNVSTDDDGNVSTDATLVTLTNRLDTGIAIADIDVDAPDGLDVDLESAPTSVSSEGSAAIEATLTCEESFEDERLSVSVAITADGVSAEIPGDAETRSVSVTCGEDA